MRQSEATDRDAYVSALFPGIGERTAELESSMRRLGRLSAATTQTDAQILTFLVRAFDVRRIVEFGTLAGFSCLTMARALPDDGRIVTLEADPDCALEARRNFARSEHADRISLLEGDALTSAATLTGPFDMVFIDARKREYPAYLDWAENHLRAGGVVAADNAFLSGEVFDPENTTTRADAVREFNRRLADSDRYISTLLPTGDGMMVGLLRG